MIDLTINYYIWNTFARIVHSQPNQYRYAYRSHTCRNGEKKREIRAIQHADWKSAVIKMNVRVYIYVWSLKSCDKLNSATKIKAKHASTFVAAILFKNGCRCYGGRQIYIYTKKTSHDTNVRKQNIYRKSRDSNEIIHSLLLKTLQLRAQHTDSSYELFHFYLANENSINGFSCIIFITFDFRFSLFMCDLHTTAVSLSFFNWISISNRKKKHQPTKL